MIRKLLVGNRGEIAVRIIRAARDLGIETVAIFSEADRGARHARMADRAVCIGPASASASYLSHDAVLAAADATSCDAIHPGYGFLAEDAGFAARCADARITFVGPSAEVIERMGDKTTARETVMHADVPVVPGSEGALTGVDEAEEVAATMSFPVLLKARAGGGGRGMRVVDAPADLRSAFSAAHHEAREAFGNGELYLEKYLRRVRHVEVQVLADSAGKTIHLGERDCSLQRRHQKLVEEGPSPVLSPSVREELGAVAVRAAAAVDYESAGTIEFLYDLDAERFYFIEMNTRIQVEHPVTEMLTAVDLVAWQLRVAGGEMLDLDQRDIASHGHAIECRINAENVEQGFMPTPGRITQLILPGGPGVRVDTHLEPGSLVPPHYDSLIAKVIVHGHDRDEALARMRRALGELTVEGVPSTVAFHQRLLQHPRFVESDFSTSFLEEMESD